MSTTEKFADLLKTAHNYFGFDHPMRKRIADALEEHEQNQPKFYTSKFEMKLSQAWRQKVETLKALLAEKQVAIDTLTESLNAEMSRSSGLSAQVLRLQEKLQATLDALNEMTDKFHQAIAQRDEARRDGSRVTATECQMAFANESALRAEVRRLEKLAKHYLNQRDDWNSKWAALAERHNTLLAKVKSLAVQTQHES